jgi:hypothetical protein
MERLGLDCPSVPGGIKMESPTITCAHCNTIVVLNPLRTRARGYCAKCDAYVCDNPACNAECKPFSMKLDRLESQYYRQGQNDLVLAVPLVLSTPNLTKDSTHG